MASFLAMGTRVAVHAPGEDEAPVALAVARCFAEEEQKFSRFRGDSELSMLNRAAGPVRVSPRLFEALTAARRWHALTGGVFDPGVGAAVQALGYDRPFAPGALDDERPGGDAPRGSVAELTLDSGARTVLRPPHVQVDLGGLIKGRTVDRAAARCRAELPRGQALAIDAGGDAALVGAPDGEGWLVDVEDPKDADRVLLTLRIRDRSVATSAPNRRAWRRAGQAMHHLIDPRTGRPSTGDLAQVTAVAPTTEEADVLAKTIFLLGARQGVAFACAWPGAAAVLVARGGGVSLIGNLEVSHA